MTTGRSRAGPAAAVAATSLVALSVLFAGVRAAVGSWVPHTDNAYFTARSLDVATKHHPWLGAWSSGSADIELDVNNLGALQLYLLAPFTKIAPMGGTAIGVVVVHAIAVVTIAWLVQRIGGWRAVVPAMAAVALLLWQMGSEMIITPQQHQYLLVPYLCVLVAAWAATCGDPWALIPLVVAGTLVTQTHLSYPILVAAVGLPAIIGQLAAARGGSDVRRRFVRPWTIASVIAVLLWLPAVIDQFFGWGNLTNVLRSPGDAPAPGWETGVRIVADVLLDRRGYLRTGFADYFPFPTFAGTLKVALFLVVWLVLAAGAILALRRNRRTATGGLVVAFCAVTAGVVNASQLPPTVFGLAAVNYRWLWPTAAFLTMGALIAVERALRTVHPKLGTTAFGVATVVLVALGVPESQQVALDDEYRADERLTAEIVRQLDAADLGRLDGPVLVDDRALGFGNPLNYAVAAVLSDHDVDFRLEGERQSRRFGSARVSDGTEPYRLQFVRGAEARSLEGDESVVAFVDDAGPLALVLVDDAP
ncbi:hypothetical protein [Ilumatobacter nonamiensis]|uniref:hypothetical protein n=1 Tax=Ilumatobacter nonamiensis TaxID=467093 RepID=UPI0003451341|nr:hypothetical protein [Ilumatobacter nonamiensis]